MKEEDKDNFSTVPGKIQLPLGFIYESNPLLGVLSISYFLLTEWCKAVKEEQENVYVTAALAQSGEHGGKERKKYAAGISTPEHLSQWLVKHPPLVLS